MIQIAEAEKKADKLAEQAGRVLYWVIRLAGLLIILAGLGLGLLTGINIIWPLAVSGVGVLAVVSPYYAMYAVGLYQHLILMAVGSLLILIGLEIVIPRTGLIVGGGVIGMGIVSVVVPLYDIMSGELRLD